MLRTLLGIVVVGLLALPGVALADTTVTFDNFAAGTTATDQDADLGGTGQGVTFGPLPGGAGSGLAPHVDAVSAAIASSGTNVADIDTAPGVEFPIPITTGTFAVPRTHVSVRVGWLYPPPAPSCANPATDDGCAVVTLTAYDAGGNAVGTPDSATVTAGAGVHTLLSVSTPSAEIVGFKIEGRELGDTDKLIAIDDLTFDTPVTPPPPDFTLTPAQSSVNVVEGTSTTDAITIGRLSGSSGDVNMALSGTLPTGVHAALAPNPAGGGTSTLTLTADPTAPVTGATPATITLTGTPAGPSAGTTPRTITLSIGVQPAFGISVGDTTNVNLTPCTATVPLFLTRSILFPGPVNLSVSGLPAGVQATFSSNPVGFGTGEGQTTATLNLVAPASGAALPSSTVTVTASAPPLPDRSATFTVSGTCPLQYDAEVTSMQITQGVQSPFLPAQDYTTHPPSTVAYSEIPNAAELRSGGTTVVRLYADLAFGPNAGVTNVPAELTGYTHNEIGSIVPLPGSPLLPTASPRTLVIGPSTAGSAQEGSETQVYTFTLPPSWTHGTITIGGVLEPAQTPPQSGPGPVVAPCQTTDCNKNDAMTLANIPFYDAPPVTIDPVQLQVNGTALPDPSTVFQWARLVTPLQVNVAPYQGTIDISDIASAHPAGSDAANDAVSSRFDDWVCDHGEPQGGWDMGINSNIARGLTNPNDICWSTFDDDSDAVVSIGRPLTSVAHEFFHLLGRPHASFCGGGGANGQTAEDWPPDQMGFTQSVGLDTTLGSGLFGGPYALPSPPGQTWFDFMSYCANASNTTSPLTLTPAASWGSTHNWNAVMEAHRFHAADQAAPRARATSAVRPSLQVTGYLFPGATATIDTVTPLRAASRALPDAGIELVGLDSAGHQLVSVPMKEDIIHVDHEVPPIGLSGVIPSAGVAEVEIVSAGTVLASRTESAHAPTVSVRGVPVSRHGTTRIRWRAHDADGDPLVASVDYSLDGGRTYRPIWIGPSRGVVSVPARYLSRSSHARIEITVNDGFRSATARSRLFSSPGAAPVVTILSPHRGARSPSDAPLMLLGQAYDDGGTLIKGRRLRWSLGKRVLGTGSQISPVALPPGRDRIVLTARDGHGRAGRASVVVRVLAARPLFLVLSAPKRVGRHARSLRLKVASSLAATLAVRVSPRGGKRQRFAVSRTPRRARVRITPGRKRLELRLVLSAEGRARKVSLTVRR